MRHVVVGLLLAWILIQGLREPWRALQFHQADPWPAEAPVLWTPSSGHVERLRAEVEDLRLADFETLAVSTDPELDEQGWYQYLWLAYLLPEHHLIWAPGDGETGSPARRPEPAQAWLVVRGERAELR